MIYGRNKLYDQKDSEIPDEVQKQCCIERLNSNLKGDKMVLDSQAIVNQQLKSKCLNL